MPILVILGNPPYNGYAGVSPEEEQGLVDVYKEGLSSDWGIPRTTWMTCMCASSGLLSGALPR